MEKHIWNMSQTKIDKYRKMPFDELQFRQLKLGIEMGMDMDEIANPLFTWRQMEVLRIAKAKGLDISLVLDPNIPIHQMEMQIEKLEEMSGVLREKELKNEKRKKINTLLGILLVVICITICGVGYCIYKNRDLIQQYLVELNLELKEEATITTEEIFYPMEYVLNYDKEYQLILPKTEELDLSKPATHNLEYILTNGKKEIKRYLTLTVIDVTPPNIVLVQDSVTLIRGEEQFSCLSYLDSVYDKVEGDLRDKTTCEIQTIDENQQIVTYHVSDISNNEATKELSIKWMDKQPDTIIIEVPIHSNEQGSNTTGNSGNSDNGGNSIVTGQNKSYYFSEGYTYQSAYDACVFDGKSAMDNRKANGYKCEPIEKADGEFLGYQLKLR